MLVQAEGSDFPGHPWQQSEYEARLRIPEAKAASLCSESESHGCFCTKQAFIYGMTPYAYSVYISCTFEPHHPLLD